MGAWDVGTGPVAHAFTKPMHMARMQWVMTGAAKEPYEIPDGDPLWDPFRIIPASRDGVTEVELSK